MSSTRLNPIQKKFYKYTKKKSIGSPDIDPLLDKNSDVTNHVSQLTKILSGQYESVFSTP